MSMINQERILKACKSKAMKRFQRELKYGKFINLPIVSVISDLMFSEDVKFPECKSHNF